MKPFAVITLATLMSGCTVAWLDLRPEAVAPPGWTCPNALTISVTSAHTTNAFGPNEEKPEQVRVLEGRYLGLAETFLREKRCVLGGNESGEALHIKVEKMQQLSALPQEWLTGLSLGLIPSWGTRPAEVRFSFEQGRRNASYVVDDKRVNHLILFPVFWLSFFLADNDAVFKSALNEFTAGL